MLKDETPERDLTITEGTVKVILAAAAGYIVKQLVEKGVEKEFRKRRP